MIELLVDVPVGGVNMGLLVEEFLDDAGDLGFARGARGIGIKDVMGGQKLIFKVTDTSDIVLSECQTLASSHDPEGLSVLEKIDVQLAAAVQAVADEIDPLRGEEIDNAITIAVARKYRDLEGDSYTIDTGTQALTYWNQKKRQAIDYIKSYVDTEDTAYRLSAGTSLTNYDRALLHGIKLAMKFFK